MCRLDRPSSPQMCIPVRLLHACTAFGRSVNFLRYDSPMARRQHAPLPKCQNELRSTARMLQTSYVYPYCAVRSSTCRKTGGKVRPHIFHDCPGWGDQCECARRQAQVVHQSDPRSRVTPSITGRATGPCPDGRSVPPDFGTYDRGKQRSHHSCVTGRVRCWITISRDGNIDYHRRPGNKAVLRGVRDSAPPQPQAIAARVTLSACQDKAIFSNLSPPTRLAGAAAPAQRTRRSRPAPARKETSRCSMTR
jgi:hypothetical protein